MFQTERLFFCFPTVLKVGISGRMSSKGINILNEYFNFFKSVAKIRVKAVGWEKIKRSINVFAFSPHRYKFNRHTSWGNKRCKVDHFYPELCFFALRTGIKQSKANNKCRRPPLLMLSVELLWTIISFLRRCLPRSGFFFLSARDQELLNHPQFIRSGHIVNCVVVSERPIRWTTATPCTNYCNQWYDNDLVVAPFLGHQSHIPLGLGIWFVKKP